MTRSTILGREALEITGAVLETVGSPVRSPSPARTIVGSYMGSAVLARDIPVYAQLWRGGRLPVEKLVSSVITLNKINEAMDADRNAIRQIVMFN